MKTNNFNSMKRRNFIKTTVVSNAGIIAAPTMLAEAEWGYPYSNDGKIKIGMVGASHAHAWEKFYTLNKMPDVYEIVGIVDDRDTGEPKFVLEDDKKTFDGLKRMTEEEMFCTPGLQAVLVETSNSDLVPTAIRCMEHNLAIHMDKPGGEDLGLFKELLGGCNEKDLPFQMGYMYRNNPAFQFCQRAIRKGWLGDIFEIHADMSHNYGGEGYQKYLSTYKGGVTFLLICHHIDSVVSLLGRPANVIPFLKSTPGAINRAKNNCMVVLEYPHTMVTLSACDQKADGVNRRSFRICGSKGTIELSPLERFDGKPLQLQLTLSEGNDEYPAGNHIVDFGIKLDRYFDRYEKQFLEFAQIIRGEIENPFTYEHDYLVQEVLLAAAGYTKWY